MGSVSVFAGSIGLSPTLGIANVRMPCMYSMICTGVSRCLRIRWHRVRSRRRRAKTGRLGVRRKMSNRSYAARKRDRAHPRERIKEEGKEPKREEIKRDDPEAEDHQNGPRIRGAGGPSVSAPGGGGLSILGWVLLAGLGLAVLIVALVLFLMRPRGPRVPKATTTTGA